MPTLFFMLTLVVLFSVLWSCISFAIEGSGLRDANPILAPAATILCILGMAGNPRITTKVFPVDFVLIPWAALGYSLLFVLLLCLLSFLQGRLHGFFEDRYDQADEEREITRREVWGEQATREEMDEEHEHPGETRSVLSKGRIARSEGMLRTTKGQRSFQ